MTDMDWKAAMSSEIFREYAKNEVTNMQTLAQQSQAAQKNIEEDEFNALKEFEEFERSVRSSPKKMAVFRALQNKFAVDAEYTAKVKTSFVNAVMMLDLS